jgi:hypothetical protein
MSTTAPTVEQVTNAVEQINATLQETLAFIKQTGSATIDFTKEQVPLYIQELLAYNYAMSLGFFIFGFVLLSLVPICAYWVYWFHKEENLVEGSYGRKRASDIEVVPVAGGIVCLVFGLIMFFGNLEWVKIKIAPRVYIVEEIERITQ